MFNIRLSPWCRLHDESLCISYSQFHFPTLTASFNDTRMGFLSKCCRVWNYKEITKMVMYFLSMHLTMSGERLVVWTQNWVIVRDGDKSILVEEEAHCNCSIDHINIIGLVFLKHLPGYQHQKWWKWVMLAEKSEWKWTEEEKRQRYSYQPWVTAASGRRRRSLEVWFSCNFYPNSYFMWLLCKFFPKMMYAYFCARMLCVLSFNKHGAALTSCRLL